MQSGQAVLTFISQDKAEVSLCPEKGILR